MTDLRRELQQNLGAAYTIDRELGGGGMSRVFVAEEVAFGRRVVLKLLSPELVAGVNVDRFKREIQLAARLQHPHIVPVITAGESNGLPYYTMPFVDGESLRARLARQGQLGIGETIAILRDVAKALAYAHERGIVHRDIKPDNVLLSGGSASVADFGIAKAIAAAKTQERGATLTQIGTSIGTPTYMAPEQAAGDPDVDHRADIYSFACMAYEMFAGQPPFAAKTPQRLLAAHMAETPRDLLELRPDTPPELAALIRRCLAKEPSARPQSVVEILPALEGTTSGDRAAAPVLLLGARGMIRKALIFYVIAVVAVAILARAAIIALGLPDWVFPGAMIVMALGLPAILFTAYAQRVARRTYTATPTYTPGGTPSMQHGTMATIALKASPHLSWTRTVRWGGYAVGAFVLLVAAAMGLRAAGVGPFATLLTAGSLSKGERIIVADFALPGTSDSTLGRVISDAVKSDLGQSTAVRVVPDIAVAQTLVQMHRGDARLLLPVAREVAQRQGVKAVVDGSLNPLGNGFVVKLRLVTADSGIELASFTEAADSPSQLIAVVGGLTHKLRGKMGESLKRVRASPPLASATTSSLPALRKYSEARRMLYVENDRPAFMRLMREAIALDTTFAAAYVALANELANRGGKDDEVARLATRAYELRNRLPELERLTAEFFYHVSGPAAARDYAKQSAVLDSIGVLTANTGQSPGFLMIAGLMAEYSGDFMRADSLLRIAANADTTNLYGIGNLLTFYSRAGKRAAAETTAHLMGRRFTSMSALVKGFLQIDSGNVVGAEATAISAYARAEADPFARTVAATNLSVLASQQGHLKSAAQWSERAAAALHERGITGAALVEASEDAELKVEALGDTAGAAHLLDAALARNPLDSIAVLDRPYNQLARAYAAAGRPAQAKIFLSGAERQRSSEKDPRFSYLIRIPRAEIAMAEKRWNDAVGILRATMPGPCIGCLERARAMAFDGLGQRDSAIVWYERFLIPVGVANASRVVTHRRLGELYAAKGDASNAITHYQAFIDAWKTADPELQPQVADVKQRLIRLHQTEGRRR